MYIYNTNKGRVSCIKYPGLKTGLVHGTSPIISEMGSGTRELREEHKTAEPGDLFDPGPSPMPLKDHFS